MKSILFVSNSGRFFGGGEVSLFELIGALDLSRFRPVVVCPGPGDFVSRMESLGIQVQLVPMPSLKGIGILSFPSSVRRMRTLIRKEGIEIIHANSSRCMLYGGPSGKASGVPVIWHVRVTDTDPLLDRLLNLLSTRIIVNSRSVLKRLSFARGDPDKISVVYNGIDTSVFSPDVSGQDVRWEYSITPEQTVVSVVGRLDSFKGHRYFLEAARDIANRSSGVRFLIVGEGEMRSSLERLCRDLRLEEKVSFCGQQNNVSHYLAASDVVVSASLKEGFGRTVVEALAMARPVVATRVGGVPEIIQHEETGLLVDPADSSGLARAVIRLIEDPAQRRRLGDEGRRRVVDAFSLRTHVRTVESLYDSL